MNEKSCLIEIKYCYLQFKKKKKFINYILLLLLDFQSIKNMKMFNQNLKMN